MSINNLDYTSYNYLSNLASVNAYEVNTDVLTKTDPDISNLQFDMLEGINTNQTIQQQINGVTVDVTTLQGQMVTANSNISTLQGQMSTANSNISTLQGQMSTANSNISTLQSDMTTVQGVAAAGLALAGVANAAVTALGITVTAQGVTIATHTGQIAVLDGEMNTAQSDINALQTKTQHQSATAFRTAFATMVDVGNVRLNTASASSFDSGLTSLSVEPTTITTALDIAGTQTSAILNIATLAARTGALNINTGGTSTAPVNISSGTNTNAPITIGSINSTTQLMTVNAETTFQNPELIILKSKNALENQNITFQDNGADNLRMNWMASNNLAATQTRDAAILVDAGADGVNDGGTMTLISGGLDLTATTNNIQLTATIGDTNLSGSDIGIVSTTGFVTLTSSTNTQINCVELDINATGKIDIDTGTTLQITGTTNVNTTGNKNTAIGNTTGTLVLSGNTVGITGTTNINTTGNKNTEIGNTTGTLVLSGSTVGITATGANNDITLTATDDLITNTNQIALTTTTTTLTALTHTSSTSGIDFDGKNTVSGFYQMRLSGTGTGGLTLTSSDTNCTISTPSGTLNLTSSNTIDFNSSDEILMDSTNDIFLTSTTGGLTLKATDDTQSIGIGVGTTNQIQIYDTEVYVNPRTSAGAIYNQINAVDKLSITNTEITKFVPTVNSGLTYPITTDTQLGYTNKTTTSTRMSVANTTTDIASIAITQKGCYIVEGNYLFTGTPTTLNHVFLGLSTTSVTFDTNRQTVTTSANLATLTGAHITSVFNINNTSTTIYLIGRVTSNLGASTLQTNYLSVTKIA